MYYLYVRGASYSKPGSDHWRLLGIFEPSNYWSFCAEEAKIQYGVENITVRFHMKG